MDIETTDAVLILRAADFAAGKHRDQRRKDDEASPYINHPIKVARILAEEGVCDPQVLAAALLHDTIEDTQTTAEELEQRFGADVRRMVEEVTDDKSLTKNIRKQRQAEHAAELSDGAALVKLADKIANVTDIARRPPSGWPASRRVEYLDWAESVVRNCPEVSPALRARFFETLEKSRAAID